MYCVLDIFGVLFLVVITVLIAWICSKKMLGLDGDIPSDPHIRNRQLRYLQDNQDNLDGNPQEKEEI